MDTERARAYLLSLPHVCETMQWGANLVFWAGDKRIGGKMFALINLEPGAHGTVSYVAGAERFHELVEREGVRPAPYMARIFWVAADDWSVFRHSEWQGELRAAYELTFAKLPRRTRDVLALPEREQRRIVAERDKVLAAQAAKKAAAKSSASRGRTPGVARGTATSARRRPIPPDADAR